MEGIYGATRLADVLRAQREGLGTSISTMSEWEVWSLLGSPDQRAAEQDTHREPDAGPGRSPRPGSWSPSLLWRSRHDAVGIGVPQANFIPNPRDFVATRRPGRSG